MQIQLVKTQNSALRLNFGSSQYSQEHEYYLLKKQTLFEALFIDFAKKQSSMLF